MPVFPTSTASTDVSTPRMGDWNHDQYFSNQGYADPNEWWDEENWPQATESNYPAHEQYYDGFAYDSGWDNVDCDLYTMVFVLDETLHPRDLYSGFEMNDKEFTFILQDEDLDEKAPAEWTSRPLKIHPEPTPRVERRTEGAEKPVSEPASPEPVATSGSPLQIPLRSPLRGPAQNQPIVILEPSTSSPRPLPSEVEAEADVAATPDKATAESSRIVISNVQLEQLKQKMQALKQRRSAPTLAPSASRNEDALSQPSHSELARTGSNCPGNHGLKLFRTPAAGWWCSVCNKEHEKGVSFYGCRTCDYDKCAECVNKEEASRAQPESKRAEPSPSPSPAQNGSPGSSPASLPVSSPSSEPTPPKREQKQKRKQKEKRERGREVNREKEARKEKEPRHAKEVSPKEKRREERREDRRREREEREEKEKLRRPPPPPPRGRKLLPRDDVSDAEESSEPPAREAKESKRASRRWEPRRQAESSELATADADLEDAREAERARKHREKREAKERTEIVRAKAPRKRAAQSATKRRPVPVERASQSSDRSSSEKPKKKRVSGQSPRAVPSLTSVKLVRAGARRSPETRLATPPAASLPRVRNGGGSDDLLRRVLRGSALARTGPRRGAPSLAGAAAVARQEPNEGAVARAPAAPPKEGFRKALEAAGVSERKSRRM